MPVIYDDGDMFELSSKALKALLDMKAKESKTKERWTSTKFAGTQLRIITDNAYNDELVIGDDMSFETFCQLIRPAFHKKMSQPQIEACIERANFMVNTETHLVMKLALENTIYLTKWPAGGMYMEDYCGTVLENFFVHGIKGPVHAKLAADSLTLLEDILAGQVPASWKESPVMLSATPTQGC